MIYDFIKVEQPQLIILDVLFDGATSGLRLLNQLKADSSTAEIPILLCSAYVSYLKQHGERLRQCGCEILVKPFHLETFLTAVTSCLAGGHG